MKWFFYLSAIGFSLVTCLPGLKVHNRWIRMMEFPRLQLVYWGLLNMLLAAIIPGRRRPRLLFSLLNGACLLHQFRSVFPFTFLQRVETPAASAHANPDDNITILVYNVLMTNRNTEELLLMAKRENPDLILLNEPDHWWADQIAELEQTHPWQVKVPQENTYGMLVYSRLPLSDARVERRREEDIPSIHAIVELPSGRKFRFLAVHPRPPAEEDTEERDAELDEVAREIKESDLPCIVAGDMNDVAWSRTTKKFQQLSGTLDPRVGRGFFNTFHAQVPVLRYSLDHVFHTPEFSLVELRKLKKADSDHFPILIRLNLSAKRSRPGS